MTLGWGGLARLCLANMAIGGLAALPVNLFNRLMTVELAWPAMLPGLLVALHYAVQLSRPVWGHRSDAKGRADAVHSGWDCGCGPWAGSDRVGYRSRPINRIGADGLDIRLRPDRVRNRRRRDIVPRAIGHGCAGQPQGCCGDIRLGSCSLPGRSSPPSGPASRSSPIRRSG